MEFPTVTATVAGKWLTSHEDNTDFRMLLLRHCRNGMLISGLFGISATAIYIAFKVFLQDYQIAWDYSSSAARTTVMIDKLFIIMLSANIIGLSRMKLSLATFRFIIIFFTLIIAFAILADDILNQSADFSGGHLTILILLCAICIPFKPWHILLLSLFMILMLYPGLLIIPDWLGIQSPSTDDTQILHFSLFSLVLVGVSTFLYHSRYTTYVARRKAEGFLDSLEMDDEGVDTDSDNETTNANSDSKTDHSSAKQFAQKNLLVSDISVPSAEQLFLDQVKEVIEEHMGDSNFGVEWLAHEVAISPRQLQRRLKSSIGLSAGNLIRVMRLQRSAQLLEQNAGNITEIAYSVGFKDASYFSRLFKKMHGVNPSEFVKD